MKVTQEKEFNPITITLESEEEADILWHVLNTGLTRSPEEYVQCYGLTVEEILKKSDMWRVFNVCHNPMARYGKLRNPLANNKKEVGT